MQKIYSKKFKSLEEQIQLLKDRGLSFKNENIARDLLLKKNYFDIINGFETLLLKDAKASNKEYYNDSYFEHFHELYKFDKMLATSVLKAIDSFENRLKTSIAYRFCENVYSADSNANPACYMNVLMYDNPYSIHNRINTLPSGTINQTFVNEINTDIARFINNEVINIERKITIIGSSTIKYISKKARMRLMRAITSFNSSISIANSAIGAANRAIGLTPAVRSTGHRILSINSFTTLNLGTSLVKVSSSTVNPNLIEGTIQKFLSDLQELNIRVNKIYSQVSANSNAAIHTVSNSEIKNFVGHNLFKMNHDKKENNNYINYAKSKYSYLQTYEVPPFWVIIKTLELGSLLKLMYGLKSDILDKVLEDMELLPTERHILFNSIKIIVDLRNYCAHFGLVNRFRTKQNIRINSDLVNKLNLIAKFEQNSHYEIRLYDTLKVLSQFSSLKDVSCLFKEFFMAQDCLIDYKITLKLLDRMGNKNFLDWCDFH